MLIGFDASRAFLKENTGTENYSYNLLKALAKIDAKNYYLIYLRNSENLRVKKFFPKNFQFKVIKPYRLWTQVGLAIETWKNPVDIMFIPAHTLPILRRRKIGISNSPSIPLRASKFQISNFPKCVVTIHDLGVEYLPGFHKFPDKYYLDFASRYAARNADALIAVSKNTKKDLIKRYKIDQSNIFIINEGVDKTSFKKRSIGQIKLVKNKYKIGGNYFLFVGTIQPRKNLLILINAYSSFVKIWIKKNNISKYAKYGHWEKQKLSVEKLSNSDKGSKKYSEKFSVPKLVICGKKGWDYDEIISRPIELRISELVLFLDYVPKTDLPALYSGSVAFLYPSLFEGFGLPVLESLACNCPVIASDIGPNREIFSEIKNQRKMQQKSNKRAYSKKGFAYFSQARNKSACFSMTRNNSRKKNNFKMADNDELVHLSVKSIKTTETEHFPGRNGNLDDFEAMSLVNPLDQGQWSRFLYQYITMYNNQKYGKRSGILPKKSYNWEDVAQKTLNVFEKVFNK